MVDSIKALLASFMHTSSVAIASLQEDLADAEHDAALQGACACACACAHAHTLTRAGTVKAKTDGVHPRVQRMREKKQIA